MSKTSTPLGYGPAWDRCAVDWAELQEPRMTALYEEVLCRLSIRRSMRLLDIGCASGVFSGMAREAGAEVTGVDFSAVLVELARRRVPGACFEVCDMLQLPFVDGCFDIVTGLNVFNYTASPFKALCEAHRVLKPGGRLFVSSWGNTERCDARVVIHALKSLIPATFKGIHDPFSTAVDGTLKALATRAGFSEIQRAEVDLVWDYPDEKTAVRAILATGPGQQVMAQFGGLCAREATRASLARFRREDGRFCLKNKYKCFMSQKGCAAAPKRKKIVVRGRERARAA